MKRSDNRINILFPLLLLSLFTLGTQAQQFAVGDKDVNLSIGYGTPLVFRAGYQTNMLPLGLSFDYGVSDRLGPGIISIGAYLAATSYSEEADDWVWPTAYGRKATLVAIALRSTYHYTLVDEVDTWGFFHFGLGYEDWSSYGEIPFYTHMDLENQIRTIVGIGIGAKYYFTENISVMTEIGYSTAFFKLGLGFKL